MPHGVYIAIIGGLLIAIGHKNTTIEHQNRELARLRLIAND